MKFLVVDALTGVQTFVRQLLLSRGVAADDILCSADPEAALAQAPRFQPQFLVTDWFAKAPLTGLQLAQRLRGSGPGLQLALLSFDVTPDQQFEAEALGAHFLLKKPFTAEQLKAEMTRALDAIGKPAPAARTPRFTRPVLPLIPPQPVLKPGDRVRYNGSVHVTQYVVHRHGQTVVQLTGLAAFVPLEKLQPV